MADIAWRAAANSAGAAMLAVMPMTKHAASPPPTPMAAISCSALRMRRHQARPVMRPSCARRA